MKHFKLFLAGCLAASCLTVSAQDGQADGVPEEADTLSLAASTPRRSYDRGYHLMPEIKLGSCDGVFGFGANIVLEHEFHPNLAWDIVSLDLSAPYDFSEGNIGLKTGLRAFTNRFWKNKVRGFLGVAVGYDCSIREVADYYDPEETWKSTITDTWNKGRFHLKKKGISGFGVSASVGIQIKKHFFLGYTLEYCGISYTTSIKEENGSSTSSENLPQMPKVGGFLSHYGKVGYRF